MLSDYGNKWWARIIILSGSTIILFLIFNFFLGDTLLSPYFELFISLIISSSLTELMTKFGTWNSFGMFIDIKMLRDITMGLFYVLLPYSIIILVAIFSGNTFGLNHDYEINVSYIIITCLVILIISANEELIFRGIIFQSFLMRFKPTMIVILSSIVFSIMHYFNPEITLLAHLNIFLAGILLSLMYIRTNSLWLPISFHFFWNFAQGFFIGSEVSGFNFNINVFKLNIDYRDQLNQILFGNKFGIESGLLVSIVLVLLIFIVSIAENKHPFHSAFQYRKNYLISKDQLTTILATKK